jgi:parallel beta-helix repeat protein
LLVQTENSTIRNNNITNNRWSVSLLFSSNNTVSENSIVNSGSGIYLSDSSTNTIYGNSVANNYVGIDLSYHFYPSTNNTIYNNNFVNNTEQVYISTHPSHANFWDNGYPSGGNYWSNYTGVDLNHDGIGDSYQVIDEYNTDHCPLMGMFHSFNALLGYHVDVISNSTIEDFGYFESNNTLIMHVSNTTSNQTFGFIRICIPHALMNETYHVTIDGAEPYYVNYTLYDNGTHRWIYFDYEHSILEIIVVPEFPSFLILPLFMVMTLLAVSIYRRRKHSVNTVSN